MHELSIFYLLLPTRQSQQPPEPHWWSISDARELPSVPPTTQSSNSCDDPSRWVRPLSLLFCEWASRGRCHDSGRRQSASQLWLLGPLTAHLFCLCHMWFLPAWSACMGSLLLNMFLMAIYFATLFPNGFLSGQKASAQIWTNNKTTNMCDNKRLMELKFGDF